MRFGFAVLLLTVLVPASTWPLAALGQDSGPGDQTYSATFYRRSETLEGDFTFVTEATTDTRTNGTFTSTIGAQLFSGDWRAWDLGSYAFWIADGSDDTDSLFAFGFATPDNIVGRASLRTSGGGFWAFLRSLFNSRSYFFLGDAAPVVCPS